MQCPRRSFSLFKSVQPPNFKKGTIHRQGQRINPTLIKFAAEATGVVNRMESSSKKNKPAPVLPNQVSDYYLFNHLLPRF